MFKLIINYYYYLFWGDKLKNIINFLEKIIGKSVYTEELNYELENSIFKEFIQIK